MIARVGANAGSTKIVNGKFAVTGNTLVLFLTRLVEIAFLFYLLAFENLNKIIFGSAQPLITAGQLKKINVYIPSLPEQTKIANFLSAIDEKINAQTQCIASLETWKKRLLQKMFV